MKNYLNNEQLYDLYMLRTRIKENDLFSIMLELSSKNLDELLSKAKSISDDQVAISHTQAIPPVCSPATDRR